MNKTLIIIKREYLSRVKKKSFLILTLLVPFLFVGMGAVIGLVAASDSDLKEIAVIDQSHYFEGKLKNSSEVKYVFTQTSKDSLTAHIDKLPYDAILEIPEFDKYAKPIKFKLLFNEQLGIQTENRIESDLNDIIVDDKMKTAGISESQIKELQSNNVRLEASRIKDGKTTSNELAVAIGYGCGMVLYMFMLFYGMSIMRSVMEEKTNRIAEIIVSSVKPFQLMMGKILGVALVGLTQVLIWVVLIGIASAIGLPLLTGGITDASSMGIAADQMQNIPQSSGKMNTIFAALSSANWFSIGFWFIFYFLGGYFLYAALFAAVGSLVNEDPQESGQYTMPITIPIILGFVIMTKTIKDPNSAIAVFGSLFPLTSPIVMMARIPYGDVPAIQLILSALFLIIGFICTTWLAGRIYRTGILLYGKKITFKEIGKWIMKK